LESLGERLPKSTGLVYLIPEIIKIKWCLKGKCDIDILNLPVIEDTRKMGAMNTLAYMALYAFCGAPDLFPFIVLKMVKITMKYGICDSSCYAFTCYGMILCATGEFDAGYRFGQLALRLIEQDPAARRQWFPRVYFNVCAVIAPFTKSLRISSEEMSLGISAGMDCCDFECVVYTMCTHAMQSYTAGEKLSTVYERVENYLEFIKHFQQGPWLAMTLLLRRYLRNIMGRSDNPLALDFERDDNVLEKDKPSDDKFTFQLLERTLNEHRMLLSYHLGDIELAVSSAKIVMGFEVSAKATNSIITHYFYIGMAALEAAHHGQRRHYESLARNQLKKLRKLAKHSCPANTHHVLYLLKGELQALEGKLGTAMEYFKRAMNRASAESVRPVHALAYERAGVAHYRLGNRVEATRLMQRAMELYDEWGATAIVSYLKQKYNLSWDVTAIPAVELDPSAQTPLGF